MTIMIFSSVLESRLLRNFSGGKSPDSVSSIALTYLPDDLADRQLPLLLCFVDSTLN